MLVAGGRGRIRLQLVPLDQPDSLARLAVSGSHARRDAADHLLERCAAARGVGTHDQDGLAARDQVAGDAGEAFAAAVTDTAGKRGSG